MLNFSGLLQPFVQSADGHCQGNGIGAIGEEDHLDLLDVVGGIDAEIAGYGHGVRGADDLAGLVFGHALVAGDQVDDAGGFPC